MLCFSSSLSRVWLKMLCFSNFLPWAGLTMLCFSNSLSSACTKCYVFPGPFPFPVPVQFPSQFPSRICCVFLRFRSTPGKGNWKNTASSITPGKGNWKNRAFSISLGKGNWKNTAIAIMSKGVGKAQQLQSRKARVETKYHGTEKQTRKSYPSHSLRSCWPPLPVP